MIVIIPTIGSEQLDEMGVVVRAKLDKNRSLFLILLFVIGVNKFFDHYPRMMILY